MGPSRHNHRKLKTHLAVGSPTDKKDYSAVFLIRQEGNSSFSFFFQNYFLTTTHTFPLKQCVPVAASSFIVSPSLYKFPHQFSLLSISLFSPKRKEKPVVLHDRLFMESGDELSSRAVTSQVLSTRRSLTSVFGMGTGGTFSL